MRSYGGLTELLFDLDSLHRTAGYPCSTLRPASSSSILGNDGKYGT